jgi:hypothetical protein
LDETNSETTITVAAASPAGSGTAEMAEAKLPMLEVPKLFRHTP